MTKAEPNLLRTEHEAVIQSIHEQRIDALEAQLAQRDERIRKLERGLHEALAYLGKIKYDHARGAIETHHRRQRRRGGVSVKVLVQATIELEVEFADGWTNDQIQFDVEENSCINTHSTGASFLKQMEQHDEAGTCWACAMQCKMKVLRYPP